MNEVLLEDEGLLFRILDYLDHSGRSLCMFLSRKHGVLLTSEASFKWRLGRLHVERGVYAPTHRLNPPPGCTWRSTFEGLWRRRRLWEVKKSGSRRIGRGSNGRGGRGRNRKNIDENTFRISVCARLKPRGLARPAGAPPIAVAGKKKIALPLHQRLELIRTNRNLSSRKEALEVLRGQGGWFGGLDEEYGEDEFGGGEEKKEEVVSWWKGKVGKSFDGSEAAAEEDTVKFSAATANLRGGVHFIDKAAARVTLIDPTKGLRQFVFDAVDDGMSQLDFYNTTALPLVGDVLNGYNATCLVYGQTGSGKTHAMFGPPASVIDGGGESLGLDANKRAEVWGIIPRACAQLFDALEFRKSKLNFEMDASVSISYVEVYGDDVLDLLRGGSKCGQSQVAAQRYVLDGSAEVPARSLEDAFRLLNAGEAQKRKAATAMNDRSSRAHTIFIVTLRQERPVSGASKTSRLFLADLGGSEQLKKSQPLADRSNFDSGADAEHAMAAARAEREERLREAANINLGLLALKRCVEALVARQRKGNRLHIHVPYSENKLTMLLSSGLGGNSKTCVVVCAAQEEEHGAETIAALRFGQVCGGVSKTATSGGGGAGEGGLVRDLLSRIDASIASCEENIRKHERWETRKERRVDKRAETGAVSVEIVSTTVLMGAEQYRLEMEELQRRRAELVGEPIKTDDCM